jgi:hypothetical protein
VPSGLPISTDEISQLGARAQAVAPRRVLCVSGERTDLAEIGVRVRVAQTIAIAMATEAAPARRTWESALRAPGRTRPSGVRVTMHGSKDPA